MRQNGIKKKIIEQTKKLMMTQNHVTIKDIAEASYMNIAAVNYYFGSKEHLFELVITEVIDELKFEITSIIKKHEKNEKERILEEVIEYTYQYALNHIGFLTHLFLKKENQEMSSQLLINTFFSENEFTKMIFDQLKQSINYENEQQLYARYMILFSSFCMPLFISIAQSDANHQLSKKIFDDETFRRYLIKELLSILDH